VLVVNDEDMGQCLGQKTLLLFSNDFDAAFRFVFISGSHAPQNRWWLPLPSFLPSIEQFLPYFGNIFSQPMLSATG